MAEIYDLMGFLPFCGRLLCSTQSSGGGGGIESCGGGGRNGRYVEVEVEHGKTRTKTTVVTTAAQMSPPSAAAGTN